MGVWGEEGLGEEVLPLECSIFKYMYPVGLVGIPN